jgi:chromate reductase, NAD(P)H dehydrogenase (quinone)
MSKPCSVNVLIFGASLRSGSLNHRLANLAAECARDKGATVDLAEMRDFECPAYDGDAETADGPPAPANALCQRIKAADAFLIASPEYNASMPGHLKNAIDWVSRFRPQPFNGKQGFLMSTSPSMAGGNRGLWSLRVPLEHLGARVYPDMFSLAQAHTAFEPHGRLANAELQERFETNIVNFMDSVEASKHYPCVKKAWVEYLGERPEPVIDRVQTAVSGR